MRVDLLGNAGPHVNVLVVSGRDDTDGKHLSFRVCFQQFLYVDRQLSYCMFNCCWFLNWNHSLLVMMVM